HPTNRPCSCLHPQPKLLLEAARRAPLDLKNAVVVSDRPRFLLAAAGLGCKTIFVGNGEIEAASHNVDAPRAQDLAGAVDLLLGVPAEAPVEMTSELQPIS